MHVSREYCDDLGVKQRIFASVKNHEVRCKASTEMRLPASVGSMRFVPELGRVVLVLLVVAPCPDLTDA